MTLKNPNLKNEFQRATIQKMIKAGFSGIDITRILKVSNHLYYDVKYRMDNEDDIFLDPTKRTPYKVTPHIENFVDVITFANPSLSSGKVAKEIENTFIVTLSRKTIDRIREHLGYKWQHRCSTFDLSAAQIEKRFAFVDYHLSANTSWSNVLFSDESTFQITSDRRMVWRRPGDVREEVLEPKFAFPLKLMIWGGIARDFKSQLVIIPHGESVNGEKYIQEIMINSGVIEAMNRRHGEFNWLLQQDNAPCHKSQLTMNFLREKVILLDEWPPHSPDLNVIEMVWAWMKKKIWEAAPKNESQLRQILKTVWEEMTLTHVNALVDSMHRRIVAVYNANGAQLIGHARD
jgi:transposase